MKEAATGGSLAFVHPSEKNLSVPNACSSYLEVHCIVEMLDLIDCGV